LKNIINLINLCYNFFVKLSNNLLFFLYTIINYFNFTFNKNKTIKIMYDPILRKKENENEVLSLELKEFKNKSSTLNSKISTLQNQIVDLDSKIKYLEKNLTS